MSTVGKHTSEMNVSITKSYEIEPRFTHLLSLLVCRRGISIGIVELRLHAVQPLVEVVVSAGKSRGELQGLLERAQGFAAAGRNLGVARLDAVQLLLDQENLFACRGDTWRLCQHISVQFVKFQSTPCCDIRKQFK